jgi:hypothetical protein
LSNTTADRLQNDKESARRCDAEFSLLLFTTHKPFNLSLRDSTHTFTTTPAGIMTSTGVNPAIFQDLQTRIDGDTAVKEVISAPRQST